ncbi:MAG: YqeG family HAD IIIA-type phosphatase [Bacilli bacterium]|jgi:hypothetical protein
MIKAFVPTYHSQSIYEVPIDFFARQGVKNLLIDLDNTLGSYRDRHPSREAAALVESFRCFGYNMVIISNNKGRRVRTYAEELDVLYLNSAHKPLKKRLLDFIKRQGFRLNETALIGDQLLTDCLVAHRLGIKVMLTEKLVAEDQWTTRINRMIDRPLRRRYKRKGLLKNWREAYD